MEISRLFDIPFHQLTVHPREDCLVSKVNGEWTPLSTRVVIDMMNQASAAFLSSGILKDDKVAIVSNNRPEWNIVDMGMMQIGAVCVPLYPTISDHEYQFILNDAGIKIVFVSDEEILAKIMSIKHLVPSLESVYTFDEIEGADHWSKFMDMGQSADLKQIEERSLEVKSSDLATIIYTSGTTGDPKGVMLSHDNIMSNVITCCPLLPVDKSNKVLSFLPLNHVFERTVVFVYITQGVGVYYAQSMETIGEDIKEIQPNFFSSVPRLLEKVYDKIMAKGEELTGIKRKLFFWSVDLGLKYELKGQNGWWYHLKLKIANALIFSKWREALGGKLIGIVTGSAPLQARLARVFTAAQIPIMEGFGLTETSPVVSVNRFEEENRYFGSVGTVIDGVEVVIAEDGEILIKGPNVMMGYYNRPDLTAEVIDSDGWFHTGDIGTFVEKKFLKITDRKKQIFKTSGGKYVAPQVIENKFKESEFVEQIMVVGEYQKFVGALIVPAFEALQRWAVDKNLPSDLHALLDTDEVKSLFDSILEEYNPNFSKVEQLKQYRLVDHEWTVEGGQLTPTMKVKRKVIMERYTDMINDIYSN